MKKYLLPALIAVMSSLYIFVIPSDPYAMKMLFKLIPMWLIITYGYFQIPKLRERHHVLLVIGLFFCMLGDGLLHWFVVGLSAFLIGHLFNLLRRSILYGIQHTSTIKEYEHHPHQSLS